MHRWSMLSRHGLLDFHILVLLLSSTIFLSVFLVPVDSTEGILKQKTWGGGSNDAGNGVAIDSSGNTYVTGTTFSFGDGSPTISDAVLIKYDASGTLAWQKTWGGSNTYEQGMDVALDSSGNVYVTGVNGTGVYGSANVIILKFDSTGLLLWQKTWGTSGEDQAGGVAMDSSGNAYIAGHTSFGAGGEDLVLLKLSPTGSLLWQKTWGGYSTDRGSGIVLDSSGSIYVTGLTWSFGFGSDIVLLKFDASGSLVWHRMWGGSNIERGQGVAVDTSGDIYVAGYARKSSGGLDEDVVLLKFDSTGSLLWQRTWGGSGNDAGQGIAVTSSGLIYVAGSSDSFGAGSTDAILLTFNIAGELVSQKTWGNVNIEYGWGVATDHSGSAVVTGQVDAAPPYTLSSPTATLNNPALSAIPTGNSTLGTPAFALASPALAPATPSGSQSYGGFNDMFLFKYGDLPTITFQTSPNVGSITVSGASYTSGQNGNFTPGEYTITVNVPSGYTFTSWTTSGGITAASTTSNPTTVTITGPGTLTANLVAASLSSPLLLLVAVATITAVVVAGAMFLLFRRRKTAPAQGKPLVGQNMTTALS